MPTAACPCEGCLVQEWGRLGHLSCEIKCGAAHSAGVGAHLPVPSHTGVKGGLGGHCQPQGQGEQSTAVPPQWGLGPTLEHPQQTQTWPMQCCCGKHLPSQSSAALPPSPCQDGISFCHFSWVFFKRDCSGYRPSWQGADELRAASTGGCPLLAVPLSCPTHQNVAISSGELPEGLHDLFLCPCLFEVPVHSAILFLEKKGEWLAGWRGRELGCFSSYACP